MQELVYSNKSIVEELLFFGLLSQENNFFVDEEKLGPSKKELLKYHESLPTFVFEETLSIKIAL